MPLISRLAVQSARAYGMFTSKKAPYSVSYLTLAGGGGGGGGSGGKGGGGGAGGYINSTDTLLAGTV
jgi:hypothetical protein